ncbi:inorganic diphosphatase [Paracoccus siganidrum]|uniref:Inorganic pyrophosphatase n=1 Tax=Paracoccus siganidrum TaxID=1276757 RepID=A0A418ZVR0_9RHOB|nr:inorganic diphosphatase [Paracoccus siganidrum]RJL03932.1 inorganic diphosphatase [Paracoccus siganidrum]RMC35886.1 inorganic diphosphatase [Paracoccus siganidrum]
MKTALAALSLALLATPALAQMQHPFTYPQPEDPSEFFTVIEIPAGSFTKYELDAEHGYVLVDRFQSMPVVYPANYGSLPSTLAGDGDPLDGLVFTREPIVPGAVIKVRAIGVLHMIDGGEEDSKIIAVPASDIDPTYDDIRNIEDLPEIERQRIEAFFRVYKQLPEGRKLVELNGFGGANEAADMVAGAIEAYRAENGRTAATN